MRGHREIWRHQRSSPVGLIHQQEDASWECAVPLAYSHWAATVGTELFALQAGDPEMTRSMVDRYDASGGEEMIDLKASSYL